jgi:hypothetical protein
MQPMMVVNQTHINLYDNNFYCRYIGSDSALQFYWNTSFAVGTQKK